MAKRTKVDKRTGFEKFRDFFIKTFDETERFQETDINEGAIFAPISYLGPLFFLPILIKRKSPYIKYHVNQGLVLFLFIILSNAVVWLLGLLFAYLHQWMITVLLFFVVNAFSTILIGVGANNAINGKARELPVLGIIRIIK